MSASKEIAELLIRTPFVLAIGILWIRFLLQLVKADFYNPISQTIVKVTAPILNPLQKVLPPVKNWNLSALGLIVLLIVSVVLSWISPGYSPFGALIAQLAEPALAPFRKILPPMGGLDLSPIVAFLAIQVVQILLGAAAKQFVGFI